MLGCCFLLKVMHSSDQHQYETLSILLNRCVFKKLPCLNKMHQVSLLKWFTPVSPRPLSCSSPALTVENKSPPHLHLNQKASSWPLLGLYFAQAWCRSPCWPSAPAEKLFPSITNAQKRVIYHHPSDGHNTMSEVVVLDDRNLAGKPPPNSCDLFEVVLPRWFPVYISHSNQLGQRACLYSG